MRFEPIAIVGRACVLPGALSPQALWDAVHSGRDLLGSVPQARWRMPHAQAMCSADAPQPDRTWSDRGGYVRDFEQAWNPEGFAIPAASLRDLDPLVHWLLHCARGALTDMRSARRGRVGAVFGNLGFPSEGMAAFADQVWTGQGLADPRNRSMSGGSADLLRAALELDAGSLSLDAACASSLYAIKLACDRLHEGSADLMLAGAVQRADDLFLHIGFSALNALSRSGQSRPFHRDADGLIPAEGCAMLALKRLADARRDGDCIHGIVRGVGLSNDGRGKGMLVPDAAGQQRAIAAAYAMSGINPAEVSLLECHATGTPVGDATELRSSAAVFAGAPDLPIGSLKSNLGHLITAAGAAGLIKLIEAMRAGVRPPTLHANEPSEALVGTPFRLLDQAEPWPSQRPRIAAISAFGFGGNNAHLIVSENDPDLADTTSMRVSEETARDTRPSMAIGRSSTSCARDTRPSMAIVGFGCVVGGWANRADFSEALFSGARLRGEDGAAAMAEIELDLAGLRFPPRDLEQTLPQQLAILQAAREALAEVAPLPRERTAVLIGMEPDAEIARYGTRWRHPEGSEKVINIDAVIAPLESAGVIGCMPNIPSNRISAQFDLAGPGFTVQSGAESGLQALHLACGALQAGEIDAALVGAVDLCCEPVTRAAGNTDPADAAVVLIVKRLADAERDGDRIYALIEHCGAGRVADTDTVTEGPWTESIHRQRIGNAGAADGLLRLSQCVLGLHHRQLPDGRPWLSVGPRQCKLSLAGGESLLLRDAAGNPRRAEQAIARLHIYSGTDKAAVITALQSAKPSDVGPARLVLVAADVELDTVRQRALAHLIHGAPAGAAVYFREAPIGGELAFVFAGAGASYAGMGRDLVQQLPQLLDQLAERSQRLATALDWAYQTDEVQPTAQQQLWGASALSQLHLEFSEGVLGLKADAWLGYSSGETNALVAAGVWNDPDALMAEMESSELISRRLGGSFEAVAAQWGRAVQWASWTVLAPIAEVRSAMLGLDRVHIAIINGDSDCLIAGDASVCDIVVTRIGASRCLQLIYPLAVHVPELQAVAEAWLQLHRRDTRAPRHGRIYSNALGHSYSADRERCARAILDQANQTLDLRPVIERAWNDGVRVFVEHGPGGSFARAIRGVLGNREALVVSLDRRGGGFEASLQAIAALIAAGVPMNLERLQQLLAPARALPPALRPRRFAAHWPLIERMSSAQASQTHSSMPRDSAIQQPLQIMQAAPTLPSVSGALRAVQSALPEIVAQSSKRLESPPPVRARMIDAAVQTDAEPPSHPLLAAARTQLSQIGAAQRQFIQTQSAAHQQFLQLRSRAQQLLMGASTTPAQLPVRDQSPTAVSARPEPYPMPAPKAAPALPHTALQVATPETVRTEISATPLSPARAASLPSARQAGANASELQPAFQPSGPRFGRSQLQVHADGQISTLFGPAFAHQDHYARQVRMPRPPLLLADRVTGIEGAAGSMARGRIWTETDVGGEDWYLHQERMPAGVLIESGQADLMLISWLGVDAHNRGERVYRLLGCELTYHGDLPRRGDTLQFEIAIDGHAAQGDVRLMFFHYQCINGARPQLSVRKGQAGFFTDAELADSAGCLWSADQQVPLANPRLDPPLVDCTHSALSRTQLQQLAAGDAAACFGPGFELARTHTRTPGIQGGQLLLLDRVVALALRGGPWQRGYLRAELDIDPSQWFFDGHFKNDPCMPGTLMFEACLQAMAIYLASCGYTLRRDGWRFQPVPELAYALQCRGQVTPRSRLLVTEVFVEEVIAGPLPTVYADLLCTVDGLKAFHARRVALQLVPDWPLLPAHETAVASSAKSDRAVAVVDGFRFDQASLLACASGPPSQAFGPMYQRFDGPMRVARLPRPPYHFISRIAEVHGPIGVMRAGARVVAEYDLPESVWYLDQNGCARMPFAVLLEAALQPCGWLSSYVGSALTVDAELGFRNLDGSGTVLAELGGGDGVLRTEVELSSVSASAGMIIENFSVQCWLGDRAVYRLQTVFGFFPPEALAAQAGLPITAAERELLQRESNQCVDLDASPAPFFGQGALELAGPMLRMIDRIEGIWPEAGAAGLGQLRAVKDVDPGEWFFKAHFFQDPVQPGSLGLEAMLQSLQAFLLDQGAGAGMRSPRFESIAIDLPHQWKYRGQVLPHHRQVHTTLEVTERGHDARGVYAKARASLWVDGQRIYEASDLGVRIVESS